MEHTDAIVDEVWDWDVDDPQFILRRYKTDLWVENMAGLPNPIIELPCGALWYYVEN